ncbi:hypothetical protein [Rodentibacter rarus]|uniref:hypothetical protein n=1 Tax=Rodentibacter rarus TaxID=1908260 RepID=UPI0013014E95|nr:hypothetical protein [Rodentibacter rarus]
MAYSGKRPKEQAKIAAYILYHEFGASQKILPSYSIQSNQLLVIGSKKLNTKEE